MVSEQTHNCPHCGYEYHSWVEVCPDCGARLEDKPKLEVTKRQIAPSTDPRWTVVTNVPNAILGSLLKSQIEDAGIPVLMVRSRSADIAEFSHNDYVPHDLLVPQHLMRDARAIVDAPPTDAYGTGFSGAYGGLFDGIGPDEQDDATAPGRSSTLPKGWSMLPTEQDLDAFQRIRRHHGENQSGWQWVDDEVEDYSPARISRAYPVEYDDSYYPAGDDYRPDLIARREPHAHGHRGYGEGWSGSPRWVKMVYGVLLLVLSLPFILRLIEQTLAIFGGR